MEMTNTSVSEIGPCVVGHIGQGYWNVESLKRFKVGFTILKDVCSYWLILIVFTF